MEDASSAWTLERLNNSNDIELFTSNKSANGRLKIVRKRMNDEKLGDVYFDWTWQP